MDDAQNRMYNYEATPPDGVWEAIAAELNSHEAKVIPLPKKRDNTFYYIAAASVAVIIFAVLFFNNRSSKNNSDIVISSPHIKTQTDPEKNNSVIITVPTEEKITAPNNDESLPKNKTQKGGLRETLNKKNNHNPDNDLIASNETRYITIDGPQGQPVKISSKMATLIDSSETKVSSKPIWNKKINEWKEIMKSNTLAPTTGNFLDLIELTKSLKDNK